MSNITTIVDPITPIKNWPSIPIFQKLIRKAAAAAKPTITRGVLSTTIFASPAELKKVKTMNSSYTDAGGTPEAMSIPKVIPKPKINDPIIIPVLIAQETLCLTSRVIRLALNIE